MQGHVDNHLIKKMKSLALLSVLLYAQSSAHAQSKASYKPGADFYTIADFESVQKIDAHVHIRTLNTTFAHQAKKDNFRLLSIVVDEDPGIELQQRILYQASGILYVFASGMPFV